MTIKTTNAFDKQYVKLRPEIQEKFKQRVRMFMENPKAVELRDHALLGEYKGYRSINITGDVRALYKLEGNNLVIFGFIGSHSQLYGR